MNKTRLTLITVNGVSKLVHLQVYPDGKAKIPVTDLYRLFGLKPNSCIRLGS